MSKKGKRLREFEKKNRAFSVRKTKQKEYAPQENTGEVFDIERRSRSSSEKKEIKKKKKTVINIRRLAVSAVAFIFVVSVGFSAFKLLSLKSERDRLMERQAELNQLKEELTAELEHVDSAEYIEQQARKNLRLIKKNEILFILSDSEKDKASDDAKNDEASADGSAAADGNAAESTAGSGDVSSADGSADTDKSDNQDES